MPLPRGMSLGPYDILSLIAVGETGETYQARDARGDRTLALRTLRAGVRECDVRDRFLRAASFVTTLAHPNICRFYDLGREGDVDFVTMEYAEGETLASRMAAGPLSVADGVAYAAQIADALAHAHAHGVVHGDLTPDRILVAGDRVKLCGFDLAGSPAEPSHYTAPEVVAGRAPDARADIWALGCMLFEMLARQRAFVGTRAFLAGSILRDEPPPLSSAQPLAPAALDEIIRGCLAKDPVARIQSAAELARRLPEAAVPLPAPAGTTRARRTGRLVVAAAAVLAAVSAVAVWSLLASL